MTNSKRPRMRNVWTQVHLWLGVSLGVVGAFIGLSGSALVYDDVIDAWLNPQRYAISGPPAELPLSEYAQRAQEALAPGARITAIRLPDQDEGPIAVLARSGDGTPLQRVYLDPPTGRVLDVSSGRDLLGWLHSFHESLTLREYNGREIVGAVGIAMVISSLIGIYLWWPTGGLRRSAFGFRRGLALHRNLHYTIGIWGALVLATLSFTGIFLAYPDAGRAAVGAIVSVSPPQRAVRSTSSGGNPIGPDEAWAIALNLYPRARVTGVGFPASPGGAYRIGLRESGDTASRSGTVVFVDPRSKAILYRLDRATRRGGDTFLLWDRILHEGGAFGGAGRFVNFLGGLLPTFLVVTGIIMWARKRNRQKISMPTPVGAGAKN